LRMIHRLPVWLVLGRIVEVYPSADMNRLALDDVDGLYTSVPRQMGAARGSGDPYADGVRFLDRRPLTFWVIAGSYKLFGFGEHPGRLPVLAAARNPGVLWHSFIDEHVLRLDQGVGRNFATSAGERATPIPPSGLRYARLRPVLHWGGPRGKLHDPLSGGPGAIITRVHPAGPLVRGLASDLSGWAALGPRLSLHQPSKSHTYASSDRHHLDDENTSPAATPLRLRSR
jgi:hypothetical protein